MYLATIVLLMAVFPLASIAVEATVHGPAELMMLAGKWFVFWGVGIRLLTAGIRQSLQPSFTAVSIFGIRDPDAQKIVQELGFANVSMGLLGVLSLAFPAWLVPSALAGCVFYALAGVKHVFNAGRSAKENIATVSDLLFALVLAGFLASQFLG